MDVVEQHVNSSSGNSAEQNSKVVVKVDPAVNVVVGDDSTNNSCNIIDKSNIPSNLAEDKKDGNSTYNVSSSITGALTLRHWVKQGQVGDGKCSYNL